ncbi:MAG: hypothetical protein IT492_16205 [Gammaproteobacteria bacterium]|nr:hypothetical protein [Gammaproteobacteria bacterium]
MSQDAPSLDELLLTVRQFVDEIAPQLAGRDRYHALCASFLVEIARREIAGGGDDSEERAMLGHYLGPTEPGANGLAALAQAIRGGRLDDRFDELLKDLTDHVVRQVRVTRPDVLDAMHREGGSQG